MNYKVGHFIQGRLRLETNYTFTIVQANNLKYLLEEIHGVEAYIYKRTGSVLIKYEYTDNLDEALKVLESTTFSSLDTVERGELFFKEQDEVEIFDIVRNHLLRRFFIKNFLPAPLKLILTFIRASGFIRKGIKSFMKDGFTVEVLDATAIALSLTDSSPAHAASIMALLSFGEDLEQWMEHKSKKDLAQSLAINIDSVWVIKDDERILKSLHDVVYGDLVEVMTGHTIPVDGIVDHGVAMVNESSFTGEPISVEKHKGSYVFASTVIEDGSLVIKTDKAYDDSRLKNIIDLIAESENLKSSSQIRAERVADNLVKYSFIAAGLTFLFTGSLTKVKSFFMVDFSCALRLVIPISVMTALSQSSDIGAVVKGGIAMEKLKDTNTVVIDKTGTLTLSQPTLRELYTFGKYSEDEIMQMAACIEEHFPHPIAKSIVNRAKEMGQCHVSENHSKPEYIIAHGIAAYYKDLRCVIGSKHFVIEDEGVNISEEAHAKIDALKENNSILYFAIDNNLEAIFLIEDPIREEAYHTIKQFRDLGYDDICMLTGDNENAARYAAEELKLDYYKSEVMPEDKSAFVKSRQADGRNVLMIGDGVNDSVAISNADVGVSMSDGSDIAKEISNITITSNDLSIITRTIHISRHLDKRIHKSYNQIIGFNSALIILGVLGFLGSGTTSLLHNGSTIIFALNAMRDYDIEKNIEDDE